MLGVLSERDMILALEELSILEETGNKYINMYGDTSILEVCTNFKGNKRRET